MAKAKRTVEEPDSLLFEQLQKLLLDGFEVKHPFTVESFLGVTEVRFNFRVAHRELLAFFLAVIVARNERVSGRTMDSYTDEESRTLLASHDEDRRRFMPLVLELFEQQMERKIEEALGQLFSEVKWQALHRLGYSLEIGKLRQKLEDAAFNETKNRLDVPGSGRYPGSVQSKGDRQRKAAENEAKIIIAIGELEADKELDAEHRFWNVEREKVVKKLDISDRTLSRWLHACGKNLDELIDIAASRQRKKTN